MGLINCAVCMQCSSMCLVKVWGVIWYYYYCTATYSVGKSDIALFASARTFTALLKKIQKGTLQLSRHFHKDVYHILKNGGSILFKARSSHSLLKGRRGKNGKTLIMFWDARWKHKLSCDIFFFKCERAPPRLVLMSVYNPTTLDVCDTERTKKKPQHKLYFGVGIAVLYWVRGSIKTVSFFTH